MSDLSAVLRSEITRLSKKAVKQQVFALQRASASYRHQLATVKRRLSQTEKELAALRQVVGKVARSEPEKPETAVRFVAKGLKPLRNRLGLSAREFGLLVGVSEQAVYNWETRKSVPRSAQVQKIAALRSIGKREAHSQLALLVPAEKKKNGTRTKK